MAHVHGIDLGVFAFTQCHQNISKEADTFRLSLSFHPPPSHRSAPMTEWLVHLHLHRAEWQLQARVPRGGAITDSQNVERAQLLDGARRHRPLFVDQDLAVGWELISDTHYPFQTKCLPSRARCATHGSPGPALVTPTHNAIPEGRGTMLFRLMTPLS